MQCLNCSVNTPLVYTNTSTPAQMARGGGGDAVSIPWGGKQWGKQVKEGGEGNILVGLSVWCGQGGGRWC